MTMIAAMPIYDKNHSKIFFGTVGPWYVASNLVIYAFLYENRKKVYISETIAASDLNFVDADN